jgi:hypothetical protein
VVLPHRTLVPESTLLVFTVLLPHIMLLPLIELTPHIMGCPCTSIPDRTWLPHTAVSDHVLDPPQRRELPFIRTTCPWLSTAAFGDMALPTPLAGNALLASAA